MSIDQATADCRSLATRNW